MRRKISTTEEFDPARVRPLPDQPRKRFAGIKELAASIREVGQSTPGIVTLIVGDAAFDAQLIDGERRLRACKLLGAPFRAEVVKDPADAFAASFAANFGKQEHDAIEIASALGRLKDAGRSVESLAALAGKSDGWVYGHLNLLKLHPDVQAMMIPGEQENQRPKITFQVAQYLSKLNEAKQLKFARRIAKSVMGLAAVRRMILRDEDYQKADTRGRDRHDIAAVERIVADTRDRIGVYLDMPGSKINALIDQLTNRDKRLLVEAIEDLATDLTGLSSAVEARIPKVARAVTR
jgi:ParB family chromosome partitioning protein